MLYFCIILDLHPGNIICQKVIQNRNDWFTFNITRKIHKAYNIFTNRNDEDLNKSDREEKNEVWRLVMIDAGLTTHLSLYNQRNFLDVFQAIVMNDGVKVGRLMIERSPSKSCIGANEFCEEMAAIVKEVHQGGLSLQNVSVGVLLQRLLVACYRHQVKLEAQFASLLLALGVLEGLGRRLDPNVDILRMASPYILRATLKEIRNTSQFKNSEIKSDD
jgi:aarF domain-containing kinase